MTRLLSLLALTASVLPLAVATSSASSSSAGCKPDTQFDFLGFCIDLDINGNKDCKGTAPTGKSCPDSWFWNTKANHCTPQSPGASGSTSCSDGKSWDSNSLCCTKPSGPTTTKAAATTSKVATTSATPPAATSSSSSCSSNEFPWTGLKGECCLPHGGQPNPPSPPSGSSCPSTWYWHQDQSCCVPSTPSPPTPSCPAGKSWKDQCCKPTGGASTSPALTSPVKTGTLTATTPAASSTSSCGQNEFSWLGLKGECCLPHGGKPNPPSPPPSQTCPSTWWWHEGQGCCVPSTPSPPQPSCPSGHFWSSWWCSPNGGTPTTTSKAPSSTGTCSDNEFSWWGLKGQCCIPHGGKPNPPSPPPGQSCPSTWWWHSDQGCCVPSKPSPPTPTCPPGNSWKDQCCKPSGPQPSGHYSKRHKKKRTATLCPAGLEACAVKGVFGLSSDYECVDTTQDVQSCGGCASTSSEFDCTAIQGSWNVGCEQGSCKVYSCQAGYKLTSKNTCEPL